MQAIDAIDGNTPFTFGPKLNNINYYNISQYTDLYWPEYTNRIIYQINHLHPKPFINKDPQIGYNPSTWWYHRTDGQDGEGADNDDAMHKAGIIAHLNPGINWRDYYNAPIYIDQWGCDFTQPGYLDYERDMLEIFQELDHLPNTRWTYYMSGERAIMNNVFNPGVWQIHKPLFDFFALANIGNLIWPYEIATTNYNISDNNITTNAISPILPWTIDYEFSQPFVCDKIELWNGNTFEDEDPNSITVFGSNDGVSWSFISVISNITFYERMTQYVSPKFNNSIAYKHYRAVITSNNGGESTIISNLDFFPASPINTLGIEDEKYFTKNYSTFPNPVINKLTILPKDISKAFEIEIYDFTGKRLLSCETISQIDFSNFSSGVYLIKITQDSTVWQEKIIKK